MNCTLHGENKRMTDIALHWFCGLCRMRIFFANEQLNYLKFGDYQVEDDSKLEHDIEFWSKVKEYWEKKLSELKE